jgi:hypothetical protein
MQAQGVLPFRYEGEPTKSGMTALAGLPAYLELAVVSGLTSSIRRHLQVCTEKKQGWTDSQIVMPLVLLNVAGGDSVDDLRQLEGDVGFVQVLRRIEMHGLRRKERRDLERRWRKERKRAVPSPSAVFRYLLSFDNPAEEEKRVAGRAFIPAPNRHLLALGMVNGDLLCFGQQKSPQSQATLDQDASAVETHKEGALFCYLGYKAYQPLTIYWAEQAMVVISELRDGNVPASYGNLRQVQEALAVLPKGVLRVNYRGDTASYQRELLQYCAEGKNERFGVIEFAVGVDVTLEFKRAVAEVKAGDWHPLEREVAGKIVPTGQEWAEVCFVPSWTAHRKDGPTYRFLAIRELLEQAELPGLEVQLPFPTMAFGDKHYKLFGLVTNRDIPGDELIWWHRKRCGKGEEMHKIMKEDPAGGHLPSAHFGADAAWWGIMVLAFNLNSLMKRLVLPKEWAPRRLKAIRFGFINLAGRVVCGSRQLAIRLSQSHPGYQLLLEVRRRLKALWNGVPPCAAAAPP